VGGARVAHRPGELVGQRPRVAERYSCEQGRPLGRKASRVSLLGGKARALGPGPRQEAGRRGRRRHRHRARVQHPPAARRFEHPRLIEIAGIARPAREAKLPLHDRLAAFFQIDDPAPAGQPDERALRSRRRVENEARAPAPPRPPHRRVERAQDAHRSRVRRLPPAVVARRRKRPGPPRGKRGQRAGDDGPEQRTTQDSHPFIRLTPEIVSWHIN